MFSEALLDSAVHETDLDGVEACFSSLKSEDQQFFVVSTTNPSNLKARSSSQIYTPEACETSETVKRFSNACGINSRYGYVMFFAQQRDQKKALSVLRR